MTVKPGKSSMRGVALGILAFCSVWAWALTDNAMHRPGVTTTDIVLPAVPAGVMLVLGLIAFLMPRKRFAPWIAMGALSLLVVSRVIAHVTGVAPITF